MIKQNSLELWFKQSLVYLFKFVIPVRGQKELPCRTNQFRPELISMLVQIGYTMFFNTIFFQQFLLFLIMNCLKMVLHTWSGHFLTYNLIYETWSRNYNFIWHTCNVISQYLGCKTVKNVLREGLQSSFSNVSVLFLFKKSLGNWTKLHLLLIRISRPTLSMWRWERTWSSTKPRKV